MAWNCPVCGFSEKGTQAPANCPVCGTPGKRFTSSDIAQNESAPQSKDEAAKAADVEKPPEPAERRKCPVCGYTRSGEHSDERCPVCGTAGERFISPDGAPVAAKETETAALRREPTLTGEQERKWLCTVCGYIHTGPEPPEKCPVCGSDRSVFVEVTPQAADKPEAEEAPSPGGGVMPPAASPWIQRFNLMRDKMVELHAHPIAVHIPNGLLPITVLFLLLAMVFGSKSLSTASFYNLIVVTLAMPVVLFSGYNDWQKRFGGSMTPVFMTKIVCGAIITAGSFILVVWRLVSPGVTMAGSDGRWGYLLVHLVLLAAAAIAGYQGGKLIIFPDASGNE